VGLLAAPQHLRQIAAADVLHRDEVPAVVLAELEGLDRCSGCWTASSRALPSRWNMSTTGLARELWPHDLDREQPARADLGLAR